MGPIYLFAGNISEEMLRGVRKLGPGYAYSFEPPQLDTDIPGASAANLGKTGGDGGSRRAETPAEAAAATARQHAHLEALSGALTPLILLAYNPSVWDGEYFLDNTPESNPVRWTNGSPGESAPPVRPRPRPGYMHAMRLPGTRECVTRDVRDALDCLGGVKVLLPLFAQYDHGVLQDRAGHVSYRTDPRLNATVLALLAGTLRDRC
ncbi:unnamed protein product, partial [Laminaria digitata]